MISTTTKTPNELLADALALETPPAEIARALRQALTATVTNRAGVVEPDHRIRIQAADIALAYLIGRPVQRQEILSVNVDADAEAGLEARLKNSPALRQVFRRVLDGIEAETVIEG